MSRDEEPIYLRLCTHTLRYCTRFQVGAAERRGEGPEQEMRGAARSRERVRSFCQSRVKSFASSPAVG